MDLEITLTAHLITIILGFSIGLLWGEAFSGFDGQVKYGNDGYESWPRWAKFLVGAFLDANHHFQHGLAIMLIAMRQPRIELFGRVLDFTWLGSHPTIALMLLWLGWGLVVSDWKDYQNVLKRMRGSQGDNEDE